MVLPVAGVAALLVGIAGSFDDSRSTTNWLVAVIVGVVLLAASGVIAVRRGVPRAFERALVAAAVVAFIVALAAVVASSVGQSEGDVEGAVRIAMWTAAIAAFAHLALSARSAGFVAWGAWAVLVAASVALLAIDGFSTLDTQSTLIEVVLVQASVLVLIGGIVRVTSAERERASTMASLATSDALTDLMNRRGAEERLQQEVERARRYGHPMSVAWFDLDHFKRVNDRYGHDVGDRVLKAIADVAQRTVRGHDAVARWGGEEFVVVLPEEGLADAARTAERLRQAIAELDLRLPGKERVTASFGVAELRPTESATELIRRADLSVYAAKDRGRNQVVADGVRDGVPCGVPDGVADGAKGAREA